ncbi:uncharacterized protein LOC142228040 [Haematobia irritans]|uniref:uncharacterized protein LOC142228040 n=1 Tax=Haematobia irritans TaxID=7368 RepID=UPI003F4F43CD
MPLRRPALPLLATKIISFVLFFCTLTLKIWDIATLYNQFDSHCIAGWEITDKIGPHIILITASMIPDIAFVICIGIAMTLTPCNFGADPGAIAYNFIVGILCLWSMCYIIVIENCGNDAIPKVKSVAILSALAGGLHLINAVISFIFLAPEERL